MNFYGYVILAIFVYGCNSLSERCGYKQGQIDAINGVVKYELVKQPDGTTYWEEKK